MFRSADIVYFKTAKNGSHRKANGCTFKGHGFGMFLGHVPIFGKDPSPHDLLKLIGACGFLTFDDVADFLGDDLARKCVAEYEKKYYGNQEPEVIDAEEESILVDKAGKPFVKHQEKIKPTLRADGAEKMPLLTLADVQKQLKAMTPEQLRAALSNAKTSITGPLTPEQEADIQKKACLAMGVDPAKLDEDKTVVTEIEEGEIKSLTIENRKPTALEDMAIFPKSRLPLPEEPET
jgi:hypothetical protein